MVDTEGEVMHDGMDPQAIKAKPVPGEKKMRFWSFLQRERVGSEFLLTREGQLQVAQEIPCNPDYVYQMLYAFQKEGKISRKNDPNKGTTITFLPPKKDTPVKKAQATKIVPQGKKKFSGDTTFAEALAAYNLEIADLEKKLGDKKAQRDQLQALIGGEK